MDFEEIKQVESTYQLTTYAKMNIAVERGSGAWIWTSDGETFLGKYRDIEKPIVPGHVSADFGNIDSVRIVADEETAAIMIEPIQSMAGVKEAAPEFFQELRHLCDDRGIMLIFDEVQTGIGR